MIEGRVIKRGDNKLESLKVDEFFAHPMLEGVKQEEAMDGIGKGIKIVSPDDKPLVGLLLDYDLDSHPRFIFAYYNPTSKREHIIDTMHQIGWSITFQNQFYRL